MSDRLLTTNDVAELLQLRKPDKVYAAIASGMLSASNIGSDARPTWRFRAEDVDAYLLRTRREADPEPVVSHPSVRLEKRFIVRRPARCAEHAH